MRRARALVTMMTMTIKRKDTGRFRGRAASDLPEKRRIFVVEKNVRFDPVYGARDRRKGTIGTAALPKRAII